VLIADNLLFDFSRIWSENKIQQIKDKIMSSEIGRHPYDLSFNF
jgi:hypothetical protein